MREAITHIKYFCHLFDIKKMHAARTKQLTISLLIENMRTTSTHIKLLIIFLIIKKMHALSMHIETFTISLLIENMRATSTHIKLLIIFFDNQENACIKHACKTTHHFF